MKRCIQALSILLFSLLLVACQSETSLQEYMVDKEDAEHFISASVPTSLLFQNMDSLLLENISLKKIEKINLLALTNKNDAIALEKERNQLRSILTDDKYQSLINFKAADKEARFTYSGSETEIDELIFFGFDSQMGLLLLRMRGDNVNANDLFQIAQSAQQFNMDAIPGELGSLFYGLKE